MDAQLLDKAKGCLLGLACGDAVGTTLEFKSRNEFRPIGDMVGGGPFNLKKGQWTDDTSMALCLGHSLLHRQGFCPTDQMNRYCNWYQYGYMSSTGECFDIGMTVVSALKRYLETGEAYSGSTDPGASGNGSLMRLAPIPIFYSENPLSALYYAGASSRTTHASAECVDSCKFFCDLILAAFRVQDKSHLLQAVEYAPETEKVAGIAGGDFLDLQYERLTGSGYVIESLISALWCFFHSDSFRDAILLSANIGNDADTTAAICGQIAGAYYGFSAIPDDWKSAITQSREIEQLAADLWQAGRDLQQETAQQ